MPISELYVVQRLLQETTSARDPLGWNETESDGYFAELNGVRMELARVESTTDSIIHITLTQGRHRVQIAEPLKRGFLRAKYGSEDDHQLARLLARLAQVIARQCAKRKKTAEEAADSIREAVFRRLLFGEADDGDSRRADALAQ